MVNCTKKLSVWYELTHVLTAVHITITNLLQVSQRSRRSTLPDINWKRVWTVRGGYKVQLSSDRSVFRRSIYHRDDWARIDNTIPSAPHCMEARWRIHISKWIWVRCSRASTCDVSLSTSSIRNAFDRRCQQEKYHKYYANNACDNWSWNRQLTRPAVISRLDASGSIVFYWVAPRNGMDVLTGRDGDIDVQASWLNGVSGSEARSLIVVAAQIWSRRCDTTRSGEGTVSHQCCHPDVRQLIVVGIPRHSGDTALKTRKGCGLSTLLEETKRCKTSLVSGRKSIMPILCEIRQLSPCILRVIGAELQICRSRSMVRMLKIGAKDWQYGMAMAGTLADFNTMQYASKQLLRKRKSWTTCLFSLDCSMRIWQCYAFKNTTSNPPGLGLVLKH